VPARILIADPFDAATFAHAVAEGAAALRAGRLVAFPTETVYGLGANALSSDAVQRLYAAKGRPSYNPLIVHIADESELARVVRDVTPLARLLASTFWPGPLTLVLRRHPSIRDEVTAGLDTVGVRLPAHPVARALVAGAGIPVAAPSANRFTRVSPTTAAHVVTQLGEVIDLVLDGGATTVGIESTVVDATGPRAVLLRPGGVTRAALEQVAGPVDVVRSAGNPEAARPSPGMIDRHYAPTASLRAFASGMRGAISVWIEQRVREGRRIGVLAFDAVPAQAALSLTMPRSAEGYARSLYAALHAADVAACDVVLLEEIPSTPEWEAITDRLRRAGLTPWHSDVQK